MVSGRSASAVAVVGSGTTVGAGTVSAASDDVFSNEYES